MLEWLMANWQPLLVVIIIAILMIIYLAKRKGIRQLATDAIVWAEETFKSEDGQKKMQEAIDYCQQIIPVLNLLPDRLIKMFIQSVFDQIKGALDLQIDVPQEEPKTIEEGQNNSEG